MFIELNNKIETPLSTLWFKITHKIKVKKLLHHEIHSGKLYLNSWRIKGIATTQRKKTQNGDAKLHEQSYYKM
jgi:hypothetical protein